MKKSLILASAVLVLSGLVSCGGTSSVASSVAEKAEIALVTDIGNIDDHSFNEGCWKGCQDFEKAEGGKKAVYFRPTENTTTNRVATIDSAIAAGAKVVVLPGYLFNSAVKICQASHPDTAFLGIDVSNSDDDNNYTPYDFTQKVTSIIYKEEQAGFLAGYAAVKEGYKKLGFCGGMAVPAVVRYGQGYVAGADYAAKEMNLANGAISINYWYSGTFAPSDTIVTKIGGWYTSGTEVVFSCGGGIYNSVVKAAKDTNDTLGSKAKKVIGVDVDQAADSELIITSAMKNLRLTVSRYLDSFYKNNRAWGTVDGNATAGKVITKGAESDSVGLPTDTSSWRMTTFTVEQYNAVYAKVKDGTIAITVSSVATEHFVSSAKVTTNYEA